MISRKRKFILAGSPVAAAREREECPKPSLLDLHTVNEDRTHAGG